ncbi:hypothetical protein T09_7511 [Trichinella sp. T9]|nr:hypothetical protein T09_7511 [Trichinella sp. T9]
MDDIAISELYSNRRIVLYIPYPGIRKHSSVANSLAYHSGHLQERKIKIAVVLISCKAPRYKGASVQIQLHITSSCLSGRKSEDGNYE